MTLFQKKGNRKKQKKNIYEKKREIIFPCLFEKLILMNHLFGSVDIARIIIQILQQMNIQDTIEFRELNTTKIQSTYGELWSTIMNGIKRDGKYYVIHEYINRNRIINRNSIIWRDITFDTQNYRYDLVYNHNNLIMNYEIKQLHHPEIRINHTLQSDKKEKRKINKRKKNERKQYKSYQYNESKRRNKMIQIR